MNTKFPLPSSGELWKVKRLISVFIGHEQMTRYVAPNTVVLIISANIISLNETFGLPRKILKTHLLEDGIATFSCLTRHSTKAWNNLFIKLAPT